jgi:hypothetical protein
MSQVTQATMPLTTQVRSPRRTLWLGALLALAAIAAVVLVLVLQGESPKTNAAGTADLKAQPGVRADGGPDESQVAASVGSRPTTPDVSTRPDESRIAAAVGGSSSPSYSRPDESRIAAAVGGSSSRSSSTAPNSSRPDESRIAAAISGR